MLMKKKNASIDNIVKQVMIFNDFYEEVIHNNMSKNQSRALSKLEFKMLHTVYRKGTLTVSELSQMLNISLPNCSRYIKTAISEGYLAKKIDSSDKRICYISLTSQGLDTINESIQGFAEDLSTQLKEVDSQRLEKLNEKMSDLNHILSETLMLRS